MIKAALSAAAAVSMLTACGPAPPANAPASGASASVPAPNPPTETSQSAPEVPGDAASFPETPLRPETADYAAVYAIDSAGKVAYRVPESAYGRVAQALDLPSPDIAAREEPPLAGFLVQDRDGGSYDYVVTGTQVLADGKALAATDSQREALQALCKSLQTGEGQPVLLARMDPSAITRFDFDCQGVGRGRENPNWVYLRIRAEDHPMLTDDFAALMQSLRIKPGWTDYGAWGPSNLGMDEMNGTITFENGECLYLRVYDDLLCVAGDDKLLTAYEFAPTGLPKARGWYLRAEMQELQGRLEYLKDAVIILRSPQGTQGARFIWNDTLDRLAGFTTGRDGMEPVQGDTVLTLMVLSAGFDGDPYWKRYDFTPGEAFAELSPYLTGTGADSQMKRPLDETEIARYLTLRSGDPEGKEEAP